MSKNSVSNTNAAEKPNFRNQSYWAYRHSEEFSSAVTYLENDLQKFFCTPVVNAAFACELILKAILIFETQGEVKIHDLKMLFEQLSPNAQVQIKSAACLRDWETFWTESRNAFIDWRYLYEKKGTFCISVSGLRSLYTAAHDYYEKNIMSGLKIESLGEETYMIQDRRKDIFGGTSWWQD